MLNRLWELARLFTKLGWISFGGPAVHLALMEEEVVKRRQWLSRDQFLDLLGASNLIPGPTALEMAAHIGFLRAGLAGLLVSGVAFVLPGAVLTAALAWGYCEYGALEEVEPFLRGIKPAVLAIVFAAVCRLGKSVIASWRLAAIAVAVAAASLAGLNEVGTLLAGTLSGAVFLRLSQRRPRIPAGAMAGLVAGWTVAAASRPAVAAPLLTATCGAACAAAVVVPLWTLGLYFLKIGAVLFGGGYVLVAYLQGGLVDELGWLDHQRLMDAVAAGQLTPGPLVTTATFVGYLLGGALGAVIATAAIILPGFVLVAATNPWIPRLRRWPWTARFLDAVGAASIGLMAAVVVTLANNTLLTTPTDWRIWLIGPDWRACGIALVSAAAFLGWRVPAVWIILGGAVLGRVL